MLRTVLLSLILFAALSSSSTSIIRKRISRRQIDPQYCHAIKGFACKCSYYRVTCTNDLQLPSPIKIFDHEKQKYQSVELSITAPCDIDVDDRTFEPIKELYKRNADNVEFRITFEKYTALHLSSPGIFNRVFPDSLPANARKHLALEIFNLDVPPSNNPNLFQGLHAESLEIYILYPFHGTFQQLFNGSDIKVLRLSGGDIRSDVSQSFTGIIARLELAKQVDELSVENFPVYPAHEFIINSFYVRDFNSKHPPNYANLREIRVRTNERIRANTFRQFPNIHTLSLSSDEEIDPHALDGLNNLEKLIIKDTKLNFDLLKNAPKLKEFETNIEKLDEKTQCKLIEKLANGQVAVRAILNDQECTCVSAYLDTAAGRIPCNAEHCEHSSCAAIKNNYDVSTSTFKAPPPIRRSDGTNALRKHEPRVYTAPFQIPCQDQEKFRQGISQQPTKDEQDPCQPNQSSNLPDKSKPQIQDQDDILDETNSTIRNEDEENRQGEEANENQSDVICFNLSERKYLGIILFRINEESGPTSHKNYSAGYFDRFHAATANINRTEANNFFEKRIKEKSDLNYDEAIEFAISSVHSVLSTALESNKIEIGVITKDNIKFRVLTENEINNLTQIAEKK